MILNRIARYFAVGGVAAAVDISFFFVFAKVLQFNYLAVAATGFVIATLVNYVVSIRWVFESDIRFRKSQELALVYLASAIGLALHLGVLFVAVQGLALELMLSKVIATGSVFLWNFGIRNHFIFSAAKRTKPRS